MLILQRKNLLVNTYEVKLMKNKRNTFIGLVAVLAMISASFLSKNSIFVGCILAIIILLGVIVCVYLYHPKGKDKRYLGIYISGIIMVIMVAISYSNAFTKDIRGIISIVGIFQLIVYICFYVFTSGNSEEEIKMKNGVMKSLKIGLLGVLLIIGAILYAKWC